MSDKKDSLKLDDEGAKKNAQLHATGDHYSQNRHEEYRELFDFLNNYRADKADGKKFNLFTAFGYKYLIAPEQREKLYNLIQKCADKKRKMYFLERQKDIGGIMFDFDIYQKTSKKLVNGTNIINFLKLAVKTIVSLYKRDYIKTLSDRETEINAVAIRRVSGDELSMKDGKYKDGFHIIINLHLPKAVRRFLIDDIQRNSKFEDVFDCLFGNLHGKISDIIDRGSAHVPNLLIGSKKLEKKLPDEIFGLYTITLHQNGDRFLPIVKNVERDSLRGSLVGLFSLSHGGCDFKCFKSHSHKPKLDAGYLIDEVAAKVRTPFAIVEQEDIDELVMYADMDPQFKTLKKCIEKCIDRKRTNNYNDWFKGIASLANSSRGREEYKKLAILFTKMCDDKDRPSRLRKLESSWGMCSRRYDPNAARRTFCYWARTDNEEEYQTIINSDIVVYVQRKYIINVDKLPIYEPGNITDTAMADIAYRWVGPYYTSVADTGNSWYFFETNESRKGQGVYCKWSYTESDSVILKRVFSIGTNIITIPLTRCYRDSTDKLETLTGEDEKEQAEKIKKTLKKLRSSLQRTQVMVNRRGVYAAFREMCTPEYPYLFINKMDSPDDDIIGTMNGIIEFSEVKSRCDEKGEKKIKYKHKLIKGIHPYYISRHTDSRYYEYSSSTEEHKKWVRVVFDIFINMFPDDEYEAFTFLMLYSSTSLVAKNSEMLFILIGGGGNGKSVFMNAIYNCLGKAGGPGENCRGYAYKMSMSYMVESRQKSGEASPHLLKLKYSRFTYLSETKTGDVLNSSHLKTIVNNEEMTARGLFKQTESFIPISTYIAGTNRCIVLSEVDYGTSRRICQYSMKKTYLHPEDYKKEMMLLDRAISNAKTKSEKKQYEREKSLKEVANSRYEKMFKRQEIKDAVLTLLVMYNMILRNKYDNNVKAIVPQIVREETADYIRQNNNLLEYVCCYLVVPSDIKDFDSCDDVDDDKNETSIDDEADVEIEEVKDRLYVKKLISKYISWIRRNTQDKVAVNALDIKRSLSEIKELQQYYVKSPKGPYLKNCRLLNDDSDEIDDGEKKFQVYNEKSKKRQKKSSEGIFKTLIRDYEKYSVFG